MRQFMRPSAIERLSLEARIVYTAFILFLLVGMFSSVWLFADDGLQAGSAAAARYYLGEPLEHDAPASAGGPALELPESSGSVGLRLQKPARQMMETFHFHLFSVSVVLLILAHLFMMCSLSTVTKAWTIGITSTATLLHLLAPLGVRFGGAGFAWLMLPSALAMGIGWLLLSVWPLWEMWGRLPSRPSTRGA